MATWTPGSYKIRDYSRYLNTLKLEHPTATIEKTSKNRWRVKGLAPDQPVKASYQVYGHDLTVRTNYFTPELCLIIGAGTFLAPAPLTSESAPQMPFEVEFEDWQGALSTALPTLSGKLRAESFDHLVDCPILLGDLTVHNIEVNGLEHRLVQAGDRTFWDAEKSLRDIGKLVEATHRFWGTVPYRQYFFMNLVTDTRGGLEHRNSTVVMTNRFATEDRESYLGWLSLLSHEFFHAWNVKRLKPKSLASFDYEKENYSRSLWIAEGITSYYDDLLVRRAGISTRKEFLDSLSGRLNRLKTTPGRRAISLSDASFDSWIRLYQKTDDLHNSNISYYNKGAVVAWLLDTEIRRLTNNRKSLDEVMRTAYERFSQSGFEEMEFRALASEVCGQDLGSFFRRTLDGTDDLPLEPALRYWNLSWKPKASNESPYLGVSVANQESRVVVKQVYKGSPAYRAGIAAGDELLAIAGRRLPSKTPLKILEHLEIGQTYPVLTSRLGVVQERSAMLTEPPHRESKLALGKNTAESEALWRSWLGSEREAGS